MSKRRDKYTEVVGEMAALAELAITRARHETDQVRKEHQILTALVEREGATVQ